MLAALVGVLLVGMSAASAQPAAEPATITGVVSTADGTPQEGVVVDLFRQAGVGSTNRGAFLDFARTDGDGRYVLPVADTDSCYVLVFIAPDGQNFDRSQYLKRGVCADLNEAVTVNATLSPLTDAVIGGVLVDEDGTGWNGRATLFAASADGSRSTYLGAADTSRTDGSFQFEVAPGCYIIDIEHGTLGFDGRPWFQTQGCVESGETNLNIRAVLTGIIRSDYGGVISIRTQDGGLEPAVGVKVDVYQDMGIAGRQFIDLTTTDDSGRYNFSLAFNNCWLFVAFAPDGFSFGGNETYEHTACGGRTNIDATLQAPPRPPETATLSGQVTNRTTASPAEDVKVTFWESAADGQRSSYLGEERSDPDGAFRFEVDAAGCYWLIFVAPDGDGFLGEPYLEQTVCVELGDEVSDLDATIDGADGLPTPSASVIDTTVIEPDDGSVFVEVPIVLDTADDDVNELIYSIRSFSSATNDSDFFVEATQGRLFYQPGETTKTIPFEIFGDTDYEEETSISISVTVLNSDDPENGGGPFRASGSLIIEDNDPFTPLTATIVNQAAYEGTVERPIQPGGLTYRWRMPVVFNREIQPSEAFELDYVLEDGSATLADADYVAPRFSQSPLRIGAGARTFPIEIISLGDDVIEPDETLTVRISTDSEDVSLTTTEATFTILDDDGTQAPTASVTVEADSTDFESDSGFRLNLPVTFRLSEPADFQRFVWWSTVDGTATYGNGDFMDTIIGGWIPAGATEMTDLMRYRGDDVVEPDETFSIVPTEASAGLVFTQESFEFTILNDD